MKIVIPTTIQDKHLISSTISDTETPQYQSGVTYSVLDRVSKIGSNVHEIYESLINGNLNKPLTDETAWILVGKTNRWRMFDGSVSSQSIANNQIQVVLKNVGNLSHIYFENVFCQSITVRIIDDLLGVVYERTDEIISNRGVDNWYDFFYAPYQAKTSMLFEDLPMYANTRVELTISNPGGIAKVGMVILGNAITLGLTQQGLKMGIQDYSVKQRNDFGDLILTEREYSKYTNFSLWAPVTTADYIQQTLTALRATVCLYLSDNDGVNRDAAHVIGFYRDFYEVMTNMDYTEFTLEIEGLT